MCYVPFEDLETWIEVASYEHHLYFSSKFEYSTV